MTKRTDYFKIPGYSSLSLIDQRKYMSWRGYAVKMGRDASVEAFLNRRGYNSVYGNNGRPTTHGAPPGALSWEIAAHRSYCNQYGEIPFAEWQAKYVPRTSAGILAKAERVAAKINAKALAQRGAGE